MDQKEHQVFEDWMVTQVNKVHRDQSERRVVLDSQVAWEPRVMLVNLDKEEN